MKLPLRGGEGCDGKNETPENLKKECIMEATKLR